MADHLPENQYEQYVHRQASEFSIESRILYEPAPAPGHVSMKVVVELLLPDGQLTLEGYGVSEYTALKDALNVFDPCKSSLSILPIPTDISPLSGSRITLFDRYDFSGFFKQKVANENRDPTCLTATEQAVLNPSLHSVDDEEFPGGLITLY